MKIKKRNGSIVDVEIINNKIINLKSDDKIFFTCSSCKKETSKTVSSYSKKKVDYHLLDINDKNLFLCSSCSSKYYTKKRIGIENNMLNEEIKKKNIASRKKTYDNIEFILNDYTEEFKNLIKGKTLIDKIEFTCKNCGKVEIKERRSLAPDLLCKSCKIKKTTNILTYNDLINKNKDIEFLFNEEKYIGQRHDENIYYKFRCLKCNTEFEDHLHSHIPRCPFCYPKYTSMGEKELEEFLYSLNISNIKRNDRIILNGKELDIYLPDYNLAIEFDGLYWHSENQRKDKNYHLDKTKLCNEKGINLIHIFEDEWIYKQDIIKSIIKSKLGIYNKKIGARKTIAKAITNKIAYDFYEKNHLQGGINSSINFGLFYLDELVSVLSVSKNRFKKESYEITRFASKLNYKIIGAFGKLLTKIRIDGKLFSYADRRMFNGNVYKKNGFVFSHFSKPGYYYVDKNYNERKNRINFQKHKLKNKLDNFDSELTEYENMLNNGYDKIWDCGNYVYEKNL